MTELARLWSFGLAIAFALSLPIEAWAVTYTGSFYGNVLFTGVQATYCDTTQGMTCTGARFPATAATGEQQFRYVKIRLDDQNGVKIGEGGTNLDGVFLVNWQRDDS